MKHNIQISFRTTNTIQKLLRPRTQTHNGGKTGVGLYRLVCNDCEMYYIGQTGRTFLHRYKEHLPKNSTNSESSSYARHLVTNSHTYTDFETNCRPLHICRKGGYMNAPSLKYTVRLKIHVNPATY